MNAAQGRARVVPGEHVAIHWVALPPLAPAQARAAARLAIVDRCAAPPESLHVAIGERDAEGRYPVAVIDRDLIEALLADDPENLWPEPLLLPGDAGWVRLDRDDHVLLRGPDFAAKLPPALVSLVATGPLQAIGEEALQSTAAIDLRQGDYARRWRFPPLSPRIIALGAIALLLAIANLAYPLLREHRAAASLPALEARLTGLRGAGGGFSELSAALFVAVSSAPDSEIAALDYADGVLRAELRGNPSVVQAALERRGLVVLRDGRRLMVRTP